MCAVSFALGRWRGEQGKRVDVRLADAICRDSYAEGFEFGAARRAVAPRRKTRRGGR